MKWLLYKKYNYMEIDSNTGFETITFVASLVNYVIFAGALYFGIKLYLKVIKFLDLKTKYLKKKIDSE